MISRITLLVAATAALALLWPRILAALQRRRLARRHGCAPPPRLPSRDPFFNLDVPFKVFKWTKAGRRVLAMSAEVYRRNHTLETFIFGRRTIWTTDPRNVEAVLSTDFDSFGLGFRLNAAPRHLMGLGVMGVDGERWTHSRKLLKPLFSKAAISDPTMIKHHYDLMVQQLPEDGCTVQMADVFSRMALDSGTHFSFGESTNTIQPENEGRGLAFKTAFAGAMTNLVKEAMAGPLKILVCDSKTKEYINTVHNFVDNCIERAVKKKEAGESKPDDDRHIMIYDMLKIVPDRVALRYEMIHLFLGAADGLGIVLTNAMFLFARNPDKWAKLREDVKDLTLEDLSYDRMNSIHYLQWSIKEVLRLHGPAPTSTRMALKPTTLPFGGGPQGDKPIALAQGDMVSLLWGGIHRRSDIFGSDADEFIPERWEGRRTALFEYLPFSRGPRVCPGQQLSMFWISYSLARLAMDIEAIENRDEVEEYVDEQGLSVKSRNGAKVALKWAGVRST